jgi:hypothetical protein
MFMCVVNLKSVNKLDLTWKQSFLIIRILRKCILLVVTIWELRGSGWFDPVGGEVLVEDVAQFFQT